jgi:hypothetical protein
MSGFDQALKALKEGVPVARTGWNGKGMFVYLVGPGNYPPATDVAKAAFNGGLVPYRPYLAMKTVDNEVVPWVASQSDLLADDWFVAHL